MITINYTVTSCSADDFSAEAEIAGRTVSVKVPGLVIEMSSADGSMGHTYRFVPEDLEAAEAAFAVGTSVTVTLAPEGA